MARARRVGYAAFLRAVNVGGRNPVPMAELAANLQAMGFTHVATHLQSGNATFEAPECPAARLAARIERRLQDWLRFPIAVMVRTMEELEATVESDPFARGKRGGEDKLYVIFLAKEPVREARFPIASEKDGLDALAREGLNVFVIARPVAGGRSGFPNLLIEKELGVAATSRNWNTLERIVASVRKTRAPSAS